MKTPSTNIDLPDILKFVAVAFCTLIFVLPHQDGMRYVGGFFSTVLFSVLLPLVTLGFGYSFRRLLEYVGILRDDTTKGAGRHILFPALIVAAAAGLFFLSGLFGSVLVIQGFWNTIVTAFVLVSVVRWFTKLFQKGKEDSTSLFGRHRQGKGLLVRLPAMTAIFASIFYFVLPHQVGFAYTGGIFYSLIFGYVFALVETLILVLLLLGAYRLGWMREGDTLGQAKPLFYLLVTLSTMFALMLLADFSPDTLVIDGGWNLFIGSVVLTAAAGSIANYFTARKDDAESITAKEATA